MKTMSRHYAGPAPSGERRADCDYCGMKWYRSVMRRDASGRLACPDDQDGRDETTLNQANADASPGDGVRGGGFWGW